MSKLLTGDKTDAYERWEVPSMDFATEQQPANETEPLVTQEELEAIHQQAHSKGYQMGRWEGMNAAKEELDAQGEQLKRIIRGFSHPFEQLDEEVQQELVLLASAIAGQLVHKEITTDPSVVNHIVGQAVASLETVGRRVDIHLCPSDAVLVRGVLQSPDPEQHWHIVEDASLMPSDVRVISNNAFVDASLRTRISGMISDLIEIEPKVLDSKLAAALSATPNRVANDASEAEIAAHIVNDQALISDEER